MILKKNILASVLMLLILIPFHGVQASETHTVSLSKARITDASDGKLVVSMDASGEMRGILTLTLDVNNGVATGGEWAFVVSYLQDLNPDGSVATTTISSEAGHEEAAHTETEGEYITFINDGTLGGFASDISLDIDANGTLSGINAAQLSIVSTSLKFADRSGSGWIVISDAQDSALSKGTLSLNF